jgi:adenylosuccinate synthase
MTKNAIVGLGWGDEGKSKIVEFFLYTNHGLKDAQYNVVARYQGAANAGHTQWHGDQQIIMHTIPSGITTEGIYNVDLSGVHIDPFATLAEITELEGAGYPVTPDNFGISGRAHVTLSYHHELEELMEEARGSRKVGTTKRGVGPTDMLKRGKMGIRFAEFCGPHFPDILGETLGYVNNVFKTGYNAAPLADEYAPAREALQKFLINEAELFFTRGHTHWILEGAQGGGLDVDHGTYPFVTSTSPTRPYPNPDKTYGVAKVVLTRVGAGPRPTFIRDAAIQGRLRKGRDPRTAEYGATSGRPRDCCWFDGPLIRSNVLAAGVDAFALTKMDELSGIDPLYIARGYRHNGQDFPFPPDDRRVWDEIEPVYMKLPGWPDDAFDTVDAGTPYGRLHDSIRRYVDTVENITGRPVEILSKGPEKHDTIVRR